jgi:hypothetical protein
MNDEVKHAIHIADSHCKLGPNLGTPTQKHGDESVPMKVIRIHGVMLGKEQYNTLMRDEHAWDMTFQDVPGKAPIPYWRGKFKPPYTPEIDKYVECHAHIKFSIEFNVWFDDCHCQAILLDPQEGGLVELSFNIVCPKARVRGNLDRLDDFLRGTANISFTFGIPEADAEKKKEAKPDPNVEPELPMDHSTSNTTAAAAAAKNGKAGDAQRASTTH